jgi:glycosyltransferase involved in cell wall biosynthesis
MQHCLIYYPDYAHANPYQAMLYASIDGAFPARAGTIADALEALRRADWPQRTIFHVHWEDAIYRHLPSADAALEECQKFLELAERFIHDGGLLVWTIHNRAPHDRRYLEVHRQLCAKLAILAQQIHVHSYAAGAEMVRDRQLDRTKVAVIPHGNYAPIYRRRRLARRASRDGRRFLLFGRLGRYKGAEELVRAFLALPDGRAELVIAGKQIDPIDLSALPPSVAARITTHNRFLDQDEVPGVVASADFMVAPYLASLTSGTLLLAMSLGRPVIAPRLPTLAELIIDGENGLLFDPQQQGGLTTALARACAMNASELQRLSDAAFDTAMRYDWKMVGNLWSGLLHRLVAQPRVRRINVRPTPARRTRLSSQDRLSRACDASPPH